MFGLNPNPTAADSANPWTDIDFGIYLNGSGTAFVYVNGSAVSGAIATYDINTVFYIIYDGFRIRYLAVDGSGNVDDFNNYTTLRTPGLPLYLDARIFSTNGELTNIGFGPMGENGMPVGANNDRVFFENDINITESYTITTGKNAMTAGPVTIASGKTVTVPAGSRWTVV
jgi:hypothetical protein